MSDGGGSKAHADIEALSFEAALEELKGIIERLERGQTKLEEAIEAYERGALLKQHCERKLEAARERIEKISLGPGGEPRAEALDES